MTMMKIPSLHDKSPIVRAMLHTPSSEVIYFTTNMCVSLDGPDGLPEITMIPAERRLYVTAARSCEYDSHDEFRKACADAAVELDAPPDVVDFMDQALDAIATGGTSTS